MSETTGKAVFLSYASQDAEAARRICEALRAQGVEVWFDQNELVGGDAWDAKIRKQIGSCTLFVPVISAATQARREGYFRLEWRIAAQRTHMMSEQVPFLLPVVTDATREAEADVPGEFKAVQWTRLGSAAALDAFCKRVRDLLGGDAGARASPSTPRPAADGTSAVPGKHRRPVKPLLAAAAIMAGALAVWQPWKVAGVNSPPSPRPGATSSPEKSAAAQPPLDLAPAKSIAVLPFVNIGADKADDYLSDGMTEEMISVLARVPGLRVPGRTSSFAFKGRTDGDIFRKVGAQLNVGTVLEGSVRKVGDKLRITAELVNVADGYHLWSETYDGDLKDILAFQSDVARRVLQALHVKLGVEDTRALAKRPTDNPEAYRLYLMGRRRWNENTMAGYTDSMRYFRQALDVDPNYALAYCGIADSYGMVAITMPGREAWKKSKEMVEKALALEPNLAEAHFSLGLALASAFDWKGAESAHRRALQLNPNLALAHDQLWWILCNLGRFDAGFPHSQRALELEPLSNFLTASQGLGLYLVRRYDESLVLTKRASDLQPTDPFAHWFRGFALIGKGLLIEAISEFKRARELDDVSWFYGGIGLAMGLSGDRAGAEQMLRDIEVLAQQRFVPAGVRMNVYLGLGEKEKALDWLEKAFEEQDSVCWYLKVDPIYDPLRGEPRFQALLKKAGFGP